MITFCISTYNNLDYLKIAVDSVRKNSFYKNAPFIIHAENCSDGTDEWLDENAAKYDLTYFIDKNDSPRGIGGGMNYCANMADTEYLMFLHSDFYVTPNWDKALMDELEKYPNDKVWEWLDTKYGIMELFKIKPNEINWYGEAVLAKGDKFMPCSPLFKCFHYAQQYSFHKQLGWTQEDFAKQYLGFVIQSNWNGVKAPLQY